jgi:hypothetical protein
MARFEIPATLPDWDMWDIVSDPRYRPARRKRHRRKVTLARAMREAAKAGASIARVEVADDKITLVMGEPEPTAASNPWLADFDKAAKQ